MTLDNKVIPLWLLVYDQDPSKAYLFTSKAKVFAVVEGMVRSVVPDEMSDAVVDGTLSNLETEWDKPFIPMQFTDTSLFVHRLEIDKYNPIHKVLSKYNNVLEYAVGGKEVIDMIDDLFVDPVSLGS